MKNINNSVDGVSRRTVLQASAVGLGGLGAVGTSSAHDDEDNSRDAHEEPVITERRDVFGQGMDGPVVAEDGATIHRTLNEILIEVTMPTPQPGTYTYPSGPPEREGEWWTDDVGELEAFTLWAFIFNNPRDCVNNCSREDLGEPAGGGAFAVTGRVIDASHTDVLSMFGAISTDTDPYQPEDEPFGVQLERPHEAEVHLAVTPHGAFNHEMMPEILSTATGPGPDIWWMAFFDPPQ